MKQVIHHQSGSKALQLLDITFTSFLDVAGIVVSGDNFQSRLLLLTHHRLCDVSALTHIGLRISINCCVYVSERLVDTCLFINQPQAKLTASCD